MAPATGEFPARARGFSAVSDVVSGRGRCGAVPARRGVVPHPYARVVADSVYRLWCAALAQELDAELQAKVTSDDDGHRTDTGMWSEAGAAGPLTSLAGASKSSRGLKRRTSGTAAAPVRLPHEIKAGMPPSPVHRSSSRSNGRRERKNSEEDKLKGPFVGATNRPRISDMVVFDERWRQKESRLRAASPYGNLRGWRLQPVIVKANDDLRQEQFAAQLVEQLARIFKKCNNKLWMRPYGECLLAGVLPAEVATSVAAPCAPRCCRRCRVGVAWLLW